MNVNPANTSNCNADWQITNIYRTQWKNISVPFKTYFLQGEKQFYVFNKNFGGGFFLLHENSGVLKFSTTQIVLSGAYHEKINFNSFHFGFQIGYLSKALSFDAVTLPDQYDVYSGYFNSQLESGDYFSNENTNNLVLNTGFIWKKEYENVKPLVGFAIYNFNNPRYSLLESSDNVVNTRKVIHTEVEINLTKSIRTIPIIIYNNQRKASEILIGNMIKFNYKLGDELKVNDFFAGLYFRTGFDRVSDAIILSGGFEIQNLTLSLSYDYTVSSVKYINSNAGAIEIMLRYRGIYTNLDKSKRKCVRF
ncbi:MAG: hypothetical protein A2W98_01630 [Bacteroidetes bacterium GWF2_33_38]|nr:MAG: hypothetical protein A2W98_01630 [Bacteroidetes bacterium GWF2_33_38]OFY85856.1 MAG: hypothetical protein A2236_03570 [Bacteroidetes bacterium RIFOXYA2_FULL_33_7]